MAARDKAAVLGLVLLSARSSARHWRGGGANGVHAVGRDGAGNWWLETCAGERVAVSLAGATLVTRPLVALSFRADDRRSDVALLADSAAPDELRRLRAALRTAA